MDSIQSLKAMGLIERDSNDDILWTWSYPSIDNKTREMITRKCGLNDSDHSSIFSSNHIYFYHKQIWFYIYSTDVFDSDNLPKVRQLYLTLMSKDFNPEKYHKLGKILSKAYCKSGNPASMLELYLSVITQGSCSTEENGSFLMKEFDPKIAMASGSLKSVVNTFGLESILLFTALALKKRIIVYHHKVNELLDFVRALPALVWHRQNWSILFPFLNIVKEDIDDLRENGQSHYIAGFNDASIESYTELYDIFVNLAAIEISIAPHSKEMFTMSKTHKEIALFMVRSAENEEVSDFKMIKDVSMKTKELINNLRSLGSEDDNGEKLITLEKLKEKKLAPATENFLFNLAVAENIVSLN